MKLYQQIIMILVSFGLNNAAMSAAPANSIAPAASATSAPVSVPVLMPQVLAIDMADQGAVNTQGLRHAKDALLVIKQEAKSKPVIGYFIRDQEGERYQIITTANELEKLNSYSDDVINNKDKDFGRLRLGYILINGNIQTASLNDAGITGFYIEDIQTPNNPAIEVLVDSNSHRRHVMQQTTMPLLTK